MAVPTKAYRTNPYRQSFFVSSTVGLSQAHYAEGQIDCHLRGLTYSGQCSSLWDFVLYASPTAHRQRFLNFRELASPKLHHGQSSTLAGCCSISDRHEFLREETPASILRASTPQRLSSVAFGARHSPRHLKRLRRFGSLLWLLLGGLMAPYEYMLIEDAQDDDAVRRWREATHIRDKSSDIRPAILEYLQRAPGRRVTAEELRYVAGNSSQWPIALNQLRSEGFKIKSKDQGNEQLPWGIFVFHNSCSAATA